jgi:DNA-directed RNA polymerase subunit RPC12/RpoP
MAKMIDGEMNKKKVKTLHGSNPFAMIGEERVQGQPKGIWEIPLNKEGHINPTIGIVPSTYFVTTGDAITKTKVMIKDIKLLLDYAENLMKKLKKSQKDATYLETEWRDGKLLAKQKTPKKKRVKAGSAKKAMMEKYICQKCKRNFTKKAALVSHAKTCKAN